MFSVYVLPRGGVKVISLVVAQKSATFAEFDVPQLTGQFRRQGISQFLKGPPFKMPKFSACGAPNHLFSAPQLTGQNLQYLNLLFRN